MLKTLVKKQLMEIFRSYFYNAKTNKKRSTAGIIAYILLFAALMIGLGGMFTGLSVSLCAPLAQAGMGWLYFALMSLLAIFLGAFGSVFNTYSGLYFAKDNDLLLSLPIPVRTLMASRLLTVYLMGLMYSAVVILPAVIVYWVTVSTAPMALLGGVLLTALISIFVLTLSCALGWVVAKVSRKLKHKSFITVIVSLAGLAIYYFFVFKAQTAIEQLVANAAVYGEKIKGAAHPLYVFGLTGTGDVTAMLLSAAVILALFALTWTLLSRSFLQITTASGASGKAVYREKAVKRRSIDGALFGKELARFTASPNYMLNCGLGILLLPISGILLLWKGGTVVSLLNEALHLAERLRGGAALHRRVRHCIDERHGDAVGLARGKVPLARAIAARQALAGASRKAQGTACAHGPSSTRAACLHGVYPACDGGAAARFCRGARVHRVFRVPGADARRRAGKPDVDERAHAHQAKSGRDDRAVRRLALRHRVRGALPLAGVEARRGCVSRHRGGGDARDDSAASSLAQNEGRTALCDAVKENKMRECGGRRTAALLLYRQEQKFTQFVLADSGGPCCYVTTLTSKL